jgi:hypothetical protein
MNMVAVIRSEILAIQRSISRMQKGRCRLILGQQHSSSRPGGDQHLAMIIGRALHIDYPGHLFQADGPNNQRVSVDAASQLSPDRC